MERFRQTLIDSPDKYYGLRPSNYGHLNLQVGQTWDTRVECSRSGAHAPSVSGISRGTGGLPAFSVVLSGGYEDDIDEGETFLYTGIGGQADVYRESGPQVGHQTMDHADNRSLQLSAITGEPVRVIRGKNLKSQYAPASGYRYDGLYQVIEAYMDTGKSGYMICRFKFVRLPGQPSLIPTCARGPRR